MSNIQHVLNNCSNKLREEFTETECDILSLAFVSRKLSEDEVLLREGETDDALSIVVSGELKVTRSTGGKDEVALHDLSAGDVAGAMGFVDGTCHTATLRANRPSEVISLHRDKLESMIIDYPNLVYKVMQLIVRSVHSTILRMDQQFVEMTNYIMKEHGRY